MEQTLTHSEWYVMDCLWQHSPSTVMELVTALHEKVGWAKSTTITTLRRMEDKGLVTVEVHGRTKYYTPALERDKAGNPLLSGPGIPGQRGADGIRHGQ